MQPSSRRHERCVGWLQRLAVLAASLVLGGMTATAQVATAPPAGPVLPAEAVMARDAGELARRLLIAPDAAARQLRLQLASLPVTDAIARRYADRLAGLSIEHVPAFQVRVLLKGPESVPDEDISAGGERVPIVFATGARATHVELVQAITAYQAQIRASLLAAPAFGVDQRTGELVAVVSHRDTAREGADALRARLAALTRVPVRLRVVDEPGLDLAGVEGGMRMMGNVPGDPRRFVCTAGFVVTDGSRTALSTAAHCPDALSVRDASGQEQELAFDAQWGWGNRDLQINLSPVALPPTFLSNTGKTESRAVTGSVARADTRAGDVVCHRGERTGYSCSLVELTDFAPAGDLCGGACLPTWTTVAGPTCKSGDSGSPVFLGTVAYGLLKGGSYRSDGSCAFYFYMSTDYLPAPWQLLTADPEPR
jgi:streptogrisin C